MSIASQIHTAARQSQREIRGEAVALRTPDGEISVEIPDAIVSIDRTALTRGAGPAEVTGTLRLAATHHALAVTSHTCDVQGDTYSVLHVGDVINGECVLDLGRLDQNHTNLFDLHDQQAVWGDA